MKKCLVSAAVASLSLMAGSVASAAIFVQDAASTRAGSVDDGVANGNRLNTYNVVGAPDSVQDQTFGFFSMGNDELLFLDFGQEFVDPATVYEVTFGCSLVGDECRGFRERINVYAVSSLLDFGSFVTNTTNALPSNLTGVDLGTLFTEWELLGDLGNGEAQGGGSVSLGGAGPFTYLILQDVSTKQQDGFDIDAVSVSQIPVPGAALLFGSVVAGGLMRRARRNKA